MYGACCVQCRAGLVCLMLLLQCYVHQLRQIRQDGQQSGHQPQTGHPLAARKSGDADWSLLSPRGDWSNFDPNFALPLTRLHPHSTLHSAATTEVRYGPSTCRMTYFEDTYMASIYMCHFLCDHCSVFRRYDTSLDISDTASELKLPAS